jgi:S1-C subfamily serine protease
MSAVAAAGATLVLAAGAAQAATTPPPTPVGGATASARPGGVSATPQERAVAYVAPSIVYISSVWSGKVYDRQNEQFLNDGEPFKAPYSCTGFAVSPNGYIASAGHCVEYDDETAALFLVMAATWAVKNGYFQDTTLTVEQILDFDILTVTGPNGSGSPTLSVRAAWGADGDDEIEIKPARVISFQKFMEGDAALLKVEAEDMNTLQVSTGSPPQVGQEVISVGFPGIVADMTDLDLNSASYKTGKVSSVQTVKDGLLSVYEIDAAVAKGMSGGPTVDLTGQVLGINSFGPADNQAFNFIAPSERLRELMSSAGVRNELSATGVAYRAGLDAYFAGNKDAAVEQLSAVTQAQPSHRLAESYLQKARALPDPPAAPAPAEPSTVVTAEDHGVSPAVWVGVAGVVVLLLVGVGLLLWRSRRRGPGSAGLAPAGVMAGQAGFAPPPVSANGVHPAPAAAIPPAGAPASGAPQAGDPAAQPAETRTLLAQASTCVACQAAMAPDQRFCGSCGQPRGGG